jgi:hypothetical protein
MKYLITFLVAIVAFTAFAQKSSYNFEQKMDLRKQKILQLYASKEEPGKIFTYAQIVAKLSLGQDIDKCRKDFLYQLKHPTGDMFFGLPMMSCYLYGYKYWTEEIHQAAKDVWKNYLPGRGDTENHWVIWHGALLLAAQTWPDMTAAEWANGRSSKENYKDAYDFLNSWIKTTTTIGTGEFDSPTYVQTYLGGLLVIYDFVKDPKLKQRIGMALDWTIADYAVDYLGGAYTGAHSRIYDRDVLHPGREGGDVFGYMMFGDAPLPVYCNELNFAVYYCVTSYHLPQIIQEIATDRSKPSVSYKRRRVRNIIRYSKDKNPPVYKTNYMSKTFSIGSEDGGIQQPIQQHTWGLTYLYDKGSKFDEIFSIHPYYSETELAMFFPEKAKTLVTRVIGGNKGTYNKAWKWTGCSPYERTFQYKNTLIVLYDLDPKTHYKHIDYHFPKDLAKRIIDKDTGWILCEGNDGTYMAIKPFKPGVWSEDETCFRFRSPHLKNGLVATAFEASAFKSWDDFVAKMKATKLDISNLDKDVEATYTTTDGTQLKFQYPDKRFINGKEYGMKKMPLFKGPFLNGNDGVLHMQHGNKELTLDFNKNEVISKVK